MIYFLIAFCIYAISAVSLHLVFEKHRHDMQILLDINNESTGEDVKVKDLGFIIYLPIINTWFLFEYLIARFK